MYERQDYRAEQWAEREGHAVIHRVADTKSGTVAPWARKNLKPWMTDPSMMAMYDGILVSDTDRLSRGTQEDFVYIEHWASSNGKKIIVARGPQYPARNDAERGDWDGQKRRARTYWEDTRNKQADAREIIKANGAAMGLPPFGYRIEGQKYAKRFVVDTVNGPLAKEAFQRIADGRTATSVAEWLKEVTGKNWHVKRVVEMIRRRTYLGEREGHQFEALVSEGLWESANAAVAARSVATGGRPTIHGYSSVIYCECEAPYYRSYTGQGTEKYRCSRGHRSIVGETKCAYKSVNYDAANAVVDAHMREDHTWEYVWVTEGGDHGRQMELARIQAEMTTAMARKDMGLLTTLAAKYGELDAMPANPIKTTSKRTGRTNAEAWTTGTLSDQRSKLGDVQVMVYHGADGNLKATFFGEHA
jgi:DNA invertase Pin-like site-specific DNA recombinase